MELVAEGQTAKHIARELNISHRTVEYHIASAIEALEAPNRLGAVARFVELQQQEEFPEDRAAFMLLSPSSCDEIVLCLHEDTASEFAIEAVRAWPLFPPVGGSANDAPRSVRLAWMFRIAMCGVMVNCVVILSILGLVEMAR